jgi:hypothetical protein
MPCWIRVWCSGCSVDIRLRRRFEPCCAGAVPASMGRYHAGWTSSALQIFGKYRKMRPNTKRLLVAAISLVVALTVQSPPLLACVYVIPTVRVGRQFRIQAKDGGGLAVQGLGLKVTDDSGRDEWVVTGNDGIVKFTARDPGIYWVAAAQDSGFPNELKLEVAEDGPGDVVVPFKWPASAPIRVRTASGRLNSIAHRVSVSLFDGLSARVLQTTDTDADGRFAFSDVASGRYFLGVASRGFPSELKSDTGDRVAIELDGSAEEAQLDIDLSWGDCGLSYADQNKCSYGELKVPQVCGTVVDSEGAAISKADVLLLDGSSTTAILKQAQSEASGSFTVIDVKDGLYQLMVKSPGFHTLQIPVRIEDSKSSTECSQQIYIQLGVGASCSHAQVSR